LKTKNAGIRIRGIYATALTALLSKNGFNISNASEKINARMSVDEKENVIVTIYDREDYNGVVISGDNETTKKVVKLLQEKLPNASFRLVERGSIYAGFVTSIDRARKLITINVGEEKPGKLSLRNFWGYLREGEKVLVQIKGEGKNHYSLSTQLRLFGKDLILIKNGVTRISKHIRDNEKREFLKDVAKQAELRDWGVLWRTSAENKSAEELLEQIKELKKVEENIRKEYDEAKEPKLLNKGFLTCFTEFGKKTKQELDNVRSEVVMTIPRHHELKSNGFKSLVDLCENLLSNGFKNKQKEVIKVLNKTLDDIGPKEGALYHVNQRKIGKKNILIRGRIISYDSKNREVKIKRVMRRPGNYDALNIPIVPGDYIITSIKESEEFIKHEYYNERGELKGEYYSITTPIEMLPTRANCIDLEIDVIQKNGKKEIVDSEELEKLHELGIITKKIKERAVKIANNLLKKIKPA